MSVPAFGRLMTAMVTPFTRGGEVDYGRAAELARHLVAEGTDTLVVCGTTGESPTLEKDEKLQLFEMVKGAVDVPVVAGTGSYCTRTTVELSKAAAQRGVDGLLVVSPYYNKPPQEGIYQHYRAVAEATELPVIVYNIPGRTGVEIAPDTLARLAELPNIVAVKESLPSLEPVSALAQKLERIPVSSLVAAEGGWTRPDRPMEIYSGDDSATLPMMALGAVGVVSVASHVAGPQIKQMMEAFAAGRVDEARRLHLHLYPLFTGLFATSNPILVKAALALKGLTVGGLRAPLVDATPDQKHALERILRETGVL